MGKMYFFKYIPKTPDQYYDMYPMIFVTRRRKNDFEGVNYHHLLLKRRIFLFEAMTKYFTDNPIEEDTTLFWRKFRRMMFVLKKLKGAEIAFRSYKMISIKSKLIEIAPTDWEQSFLISSELFKDEDRKKIVSRYIWKRNEKLIRSRSR